MWSVRFDRDGGAERWIAKRYAVSVLWGLAVVTLLATGCARAISKAVTAQVDRNLSIVEAMRAPDKHTGKTVLWGGDILSISNRKDGTLLEVLQKPLGFEKRPKEVDVSVGRFLAFHGGYLDPAIYAEGRQVTLAGPIQGKEVRAIGEIQYVYPVIRIVEIHLWPKRVKEPPVYYPDPFWYDHWWWHRHPSRWY